MSTTIIIAGSDDLMHPVPVGVVLPPFPGRARFLPEHQYERSLLIDWLNDWPQDQYPQTWDELARTLSGFGHITAGYHVVEADPLDLDVNDVFEHYITRGEKAPYSPPTPSPPRSST